MIEVDGTPIGRIGLNAFRRRDRLCSLYVLIGDRSAWEQGYGTDAVSALLDEGFDRYDLHRIELWSTADNERAIHVYGSAASWWTAGCRSARGRAARGSIAS